MNTKDFEQKIEAKGLKPIEVIVSIAGVVRWFICRDETEGKLIVFDAEGYAYSTPDTGSADQFVFYNTYPSYKGKRMDPDPKANINF